MTTVYGEIRVRPSSIDASVWKGFHPLEREFFDFMFRANLVCSRLYRRQTHRLVNPALDLLVYWRQACCQQNTSVQENSSDGKGRAPMSKAFLDWLSECAKDSDALRQLQSEIDCLLCYWFTDHGPWFRREQPKKKRTPGSLGFQQLTRSWAENACRVAFETDKGLERLFSHGCQTDTVTMAELLDFIFLDEPQRPLVTRGDIEQSAVGVYSADFQQEHFNQVPKDHLSVCGFFDLTPDTKQPRFRPLVQVCPVECQLLTHWLSQALAVVQRAKGCTIPGESSEMPLFDEHVAPSIECLIRYFTTGTEEDFRQHQRHWLRTTSRLQYTMGPLECYDDPMGRISMIAGELSLQLVPVDRIRQHFPAFEQFIPFRSDHRREGDQFSQVTINTSVNQILHAGGANGPPIAIAAYCLPNYDDIRAEVGSKQVIYTRAKDVPTPEERQLDRCLRSPVARALIQEFRQRFFLQPSTVEENDVEDLMVEFLDKMWDWQVVLHETIGHGSGRCHEHVITQYDLDRKLLPDGDLRKPGDICPLNKGISGDLGRWEYWVGSEYSNALEELRAEINALLLLIAHTDYLDKECQLFACDSSSSCQSSQVDPKLTQRGWYRSSSDDESWQWEFKRQAVLNMTSKALQRLASQQDGLPRDQVVGAHPQANCLILGWLLRCERVKLDSVKVSIDNIDDCASGNNGLGQEGESQEVQLDRWYVCVPENKVELQKIISSVTELCCSVNAIRGSGDGVAAKALFDDYLFRNPFFTLTQQRQIQADMKRVREVRCGKVRANTALFSIPESSIVRGGEEPNFIDQNITFLQQSYTKDA